MSNAIDIIQPYEKDEHLQLGIREFLKKVNTQDAKPMEMLEPEEARKVLEDVQNEIRVNISGIEVLQKRIYEDGMPIKLYVMRPSASIGALPAFLFFHGGGWMLGDFKTHERFVSDLVRQSGVAAVVVEYSRSPEARYPQAINEGYAALKWVARHGAEIYVDTNRLAVAGNSAGGNMATAIAMMAKEKKGPQVSLQVLFWPVTDDNFDTESYHQFATERFLTRNMMMWFWDNYISEEKRGDIYACPLKASLYVLKDLPPTLILVAENDVLRDEAIAYAHKLDEAGVQTTLVQFNGMIHDFGLLNPLAKNPTVQSALRYAANELNHALNRN
ncbi:MAG TPA: alpha/beta hydrolase [Cyclobacteriaceae bacterium]